MKNVVQDLTSAGLDWAREKWKFGVGSKFIRQGEKNAVKYADEIIVLSKGVQKYFMETYGRETHFIPNGVNRPEVREAKLITDHFGLEKDQRATKSDSQTVQYGFHLSYHPSENFLFDFIAVQEKTVNFGI